ncbi:MAG: YbaK/EbsC family protein [Microlunatus sp.]|nr:YbaK/EbsC family protein [Microlunatus sp.]
MTDLRLPERSRIVQAALSAAGLEPEIRVLPDSAKTAALAAAALGCDIGAIANSLVFMAITSDGREHPLLIMTSGRHRVDTRALAVRLGLAAITRAAPDQVRSATGQAIGGVAPVGHPEPLETIIDASLADHDPLWVAGGTPHTILPLSYAELVEITSGREEQVGD